ncbi:MAG: methionyl-tRNA formyltransferase [bacterium]|nr:methionyl-tRNA formyltransferase [bacterium]
MKYSFLGTPRFASIILEKLIEAKLPPTLVICNPDKPVGRKKIITPPPTKIIAEKHDIPVWQPEKLTADEVAKKIDGADVAVLAAYAKILPDEIISLPKLGIVGVHPSLLPKYRGATPIQTTLLNGDHETGTTLFLMDKEVDHGPTLASNRLPIADDDNYIALEQKLANLSAELLIDTLPKFVKQGIKSQVQDEDAATYTKKFITKDGLIDLTKDNNETARRKIKALNPNPGAYVIKSGQRIKILDTRTIQYEGKNPRDVGDALDFVENI